MNPMKIKTYSNQELLIFFSHANSKDERRSETAFVSMENGTSTNFGCVIMTGETQSRENIKKHLLTNIFNIPGPATGFTIVQGVRNFNQCYDTDESTDYSVVFTTKDKIFVRYSSEKVLCYVVPHGDRCKFTMINSENFPFSCYQTLEKEEFADGYFVMTTKSMWNSLTDSDRTSVFLDHHNSKSSNNLADRLLQRAKARATEEAEFDKMSVIVLDTARTFNAANTTGFWISKRRPRSFGGTYLHDIYKGNKKSTQQKNGPCDCTRLGTRRSPRFITTSTTNVASTLSILENISQTDDVLITTESKSVASRKRLREDDSKDMPTSKRANTILEATSILAEVKIVGLTNPKIRNSAKRKMAVALEESECLKRARNENLEQNVQAEALTSEKVVPAYTELHLNSLENFASQTTEGGKHEQLPRINTPLWEAQVTINAAVGENQAQGQTFTATESTDEIESVWNASYHWCKKCDKFLAIPYPLNKSGLCNKCHKQEKNPNQFGKQRKTVKLPPSLLNLWGLNAHQVGPYLRRRQYKKE